MAEPAQHADYERSRRQVIEWLDAPCSCCGRPQWMHLASLIGTRIDGADSDA